MHAGLAARARRSRVCARWRWAYEGGPRAADYVDGPAGWRIAGYRTGWHLSMGDVQWSTGPQKASMHGRARIRGCSGRGFSRSTGDIGRATAVSARVRSSSLAQAFSLSWRTWRLCEEATRVRKGAEHGDWLDEALREPRAGGVNVARWPILARCLARCLAMFERSSRSARRRSHRTWQAL